jgi:hypothetical protein
VNSPDDIIPIGFLEVQVWASRALIGAGFPGGAVDQAARLVTQSQLLDEEAIPGFVADLPVIGARDHGTPDLEGRGVVNANGLHALAVAPGVLDLACARDGQSYLVRHSAGAWVLPGVALHGARRGQTILAASRATAWLAWPQGEGHAVARLDHHALSNDAPENGYIIARCAVPDEVQLSRAWVLTSQDLAARTATAQREGFPVRRGTWAGVTDWGWKMLVPTSDRSKAQAGGDMGEG